MLSIVLFVIFTSIGFAIVLFESWKVYLKHTKLSVFRVANGLPLIGNLLTMLRCDDVEIFNLPYLLMSRYDIDESEKLCLTWMGPLLFMYTEDPSTYECILNSDRALKKAYPYTFLRNTKGIFTAEPDVWKSHRKALNPTLGPKMITTFIPIFNDKAHKLVSRMQQKIGAPIDVHRMVFNAATDTTFGASFNIDWSMQNQKGEMFRDMVMGLFERVQLRLHTVWMKYDFLYKFTHFHNLDDSAYPQFHRLIGSVLESKKIDMAEKMTLGIDELGEAKRKNSFNYLQKCLDLEAQRKFSYDDVCEEMQTILVGSTDTTATVMSGIILMLAIHQDYQERVVEELRSIFDDADEPVTKEQLPLMTTMELVIKESLRLFPPGPYLAREITGDLPLHGGVIPKGTQVIINVFGTHRNPKYWGPNANEFYPERFLPENNANYHRYQYIPFSAGPRNCIGIRYAWASLKILLCHLLRNYKFTSDLKLEDVKIRTGLILKFTNEDPIRLERREW